MDEPYSRLRSFLLGKAPVLAARIPERPGPAPAPLDRSATIAVLRQSLTVQNEVLLVVGWGDGTVAKMLMDDPWAQRKRIHLVILGGEDEHFVASLTDGKLERFLSSGQHSLHWADDVEGMRVVLTQNFSTHNDIVRLGGLVIIENHPLCERGEQTRRDVMPAFRKMLAERLDFLGNDVYDTFLGAKHSLMHGREMIARPYSSNLLDLQKGDSALCIASGPSARPHFDAIRAIQHEHIVICADSILEGLLDAGIEPDYVCMVERPEEMHKLFLGSTTRCRATLVALPVIHPKSRIPFQERVVWWWNSDDLYPWLDVNQRRLSSGRSTGTHTIALAGHLGVKTAYLIGHDLAYHEGRSHSKGTNEWAVSTQVDQDMTLSDNNPNYHSRRFRVPKNGGGMVDTIGIWELFRSDIENGLVAYPETEFINLNILDEVGSVIAGTKPGRLPGPTGTALIKRSVDRPWDEAAWTKFRDRALRLEQDFIAIKDGCRAMVERLSGFRPLDCDRAKVEQLAKELDITAMVSAENKVLIQYIFRAALRNLMLRLHHNTCVRTIAERNWNQIKVMRLFAETMTPLVERLEPELAEALEVYR